MKKVGKVLFLSTGILVGMSSLPVTSIYSSSVQAAAVVKLNNIPYETTNNLNMRSGAGTNYKVIKTIPKGKQVTAFEQNGNWYKVSYSYTLNGKKVTKSGWVAGAYLKNVTLAKSTSVISTTKTPKTLFKTSVNLNIRSTASSKAKVVKTIPKGGIVSSTERNGAWTKVTYTYTSNGKKVNVSGWVSGKYLKEYYQYTAIKKTYYFSKNSTQLYPTPDRKKNSLFNIEANNGFFSTQKVVNSLGETWYKVTFNGKKAYIPANDAIAAPVETFTKSQFISTKATYLYASYGNVYNQLVQIPENTILTSSLSVGGWHRLSFGGKTGYVYSTDLAIYTPPAETPATEPETNEPIEPEINPDSQQEPELKPEQVLTETAISGKTFVTSTNLNQREAANIDSKVLQVIPTGTFVFPTHKVSNGWYKVAYNGKTGYLSGTYIKEVITGDPMHREGYQFIDLRKPSTVTAAQINNYINNYAARTGKASVLANKGQVFLDAGNKYGVNALYLAAHAILESGYGTSNISLGKYNLFGFGAFDATPFVGAVRFASIEQNIDYIAQEMKATYLNPGNWKYKGAYLGFSTKTVIGGTRIDTNSEGMNFYYASDEKWGQKIASHMQNILPYNKAEYDKAAVNSTIFTIPTRPAGIDLFPVGIQAAANKDIKLVNQKGSTTLATTLKKDTLFEISEKHNDYWVKVKLNNKEYWTSDIKFDRYKEFISVKNLGRVTADTLNVRPVPSTSQSPISSFKLNEYIHIILDQSGSPVMDSSRTWYSVKLADGRTGWVSSSFVVQELK
ncbi:SH3 domain-containing protein [Mesobacillus subterraneus]|uniref:Peptide-binding protein n=1 Tax=Mesobacillus subterraneus TaxID=285983 RepID=A0A3R9FWS4_9BACI|nr:SH3 domain-containing protein [Mesobacillus subterraneus]RSD26972.1 peptide-binding protein [Mesobacillus subterraneus]